MKMTIRSLLTLITCIIPHMNCATIVWKVMNYVNMTAVNGFWQLVASGNQSMENIGIFLEDVGWSSACDFRQWVLDKGISCTKEMEGNVILLIRDGDSITLGSKYAPNFDIYASEFSINALSDLLEQWDEACKTRPDEVTVTYDGNKFTVDGTKTR